MKIDFRAWGNSEKAFVIKFYYLDLLLTTIVSDAYGMLSADLLHSKQICKHFVYAAWII